MRPVLLMLLPALAGCASSGGRLPVCDGKHLRPGNPYGSVLAPAPEGGAAAPSGGAAEAKPKTLSAVERPASFGSCA